MNCYSFRGSLFFLCVGAAVLLPYAVLGRTHEHLRRQHTELPVIAHIGAVTLGVTTIEELEATYGKGLPCLGGHSDGARLWAVRGTNWRIWADGFDYSDNGRIVYSFVVDSNNGPINNSIPVISPKTANLSFLGRIAPDMRFLTVRKLLFKSRLPVTFKNSALQVTLNSHYIVNRQGVIYTTWTAALDFTKGRLTEIDLQCE